LDTSQQPVGSVSFDPHGDRIAVAKSDHVEVWSISDKKRRWTVGISKIVTEPVWSPDGDLLALGSGENRDIFILDAATGTISIVLRGHQASPWQLAFHPDKKRLFSVGWDRALRVWDLRSGNEVLVHGASPRALRISHDGRRIAYCPAFATAGLLELAEEQVLTELPTSAGQSGTAYGLSSGPGGRLLAASSSSGIRIYDVVAETEILWLRRADLFYSECYFSPDAKEIFYSVEDQGIFKSSLSHRQNQQTGETILEAGPPQRVGTATNAVLDSLGFDGRSWVVTYGRTGPVELWPDGDPTKARQIAGKPVSAARLSPDHAWVASTLYPQGDIRIWDARNGKLHRTLEFGRTTEATFSPEGRWLMASTDSEYQLWEVGQWRKDRSLPAHLSGRPYGSCEFSADGKQVVVEQDEDSYQLLSVPSLQELVRLTPPHAPRQAAMVMSPNGEKLYILGLHGQIFVWDITALRRELAKLGLSWNDR
jgi:WD40 repeat protein